MKKTNNSINIFRLVCSVLVVSIHTVPLAEINLQLSTVLSSIISSIAVPFFFATSGYYYTKKLETEEKVCFAYLKKLMCTYFIWSGIYYIYDFIKWGNSNLKNFVISCVILFVKGESYYHFWFFTALIFSVSLATLIFRVGGKKIIIPISFILYVVGCAGCSYYNLCSKIPVLGRLLSSEYFTTIRRYLLMAFPFFVCGYLVQKIKNKFETKISNKKIFLITGFIVLVWAIENVFITVFDLKANYIITLSLYLLIICILLLLLNNPRPQWDSFSKTSKSIANFTYYSHPMVMVVLCKLSESFWGREVSSLVLFIATVIITSFLGAAINKINNRFLNVLIV